LLARRVLTKLKLADKYQGNPTITGQDYNVEALDDGPKPFYALLDVGLKRTTTGSKIFAAMKGAADGGVEIPHSETRFIGFDTEGKKLNAEILRKYIFGGHVKEYMAHLKADKPDEYKARFSHYIKNKLEPDSLEGAWTKVHKAIRADPALKKSTKPKPTPQKKFGKTKLSLAQRNDKIRQKLTARQRKAETQE